MSQRIAVLVDVQNMFYTARHQKSGKVNYSKLLDYIVGDRDCVRAIAYILRSPGVDQASFLSVLAQFGYDTKVKDLRVKSTGVSTTSWDVGMAVDAITLSGKVDSIVFVTGNGSIAPAIPALRNSGVRVEVCAFSGSISSDLTNLADDYYFIPEDVLLSVSEDYSDQGDTGGSGGDYDNVPGSRDILMTDRLGVAE